MSVAEWFGITFTADTEDAQKKTKELSNTTDKYAASANAAGGVSDKLGGSLVGVAVKAAGLITALFSIGTVMSGISSATSYADSIGETAEALGLSTDELSAWSDAAKMTGGSAEGLQGSIRTLSKDFYQLATTGKSRTQPFFKELGISMLDAKGNARDVLEVLPEIAEAMEGMSKQDAIGLGQKLGLDQGTIMLLQQGRRGVEELIARQKELGTVSQEDADTAAAFNDALDDTAHAFRTIYVGLATAILPAFTWLLDKIQKATKFAKEHGFFFKIAIMGVATAITMYLIPALLKLAAAMWANPLTWMIAGILLLIGLIALIAEDIYAFSTGGQSLIGELAKKWQWFGDIVGFLGEQFVGVQNDVKRVIAFFTDMWNNPEQALEDFKLVLKNLWNDFINSVPGLRAILDTVVKIFDTAIAAIKATIDAVTKSITAAKDVLSGKPSGFDDYNANTSEGTQTQASIDAKRLYNQQEAQRKLRQAQQITPAVAAIGATNNSIANSQTTTNSTQVGSVTINTPLNKEEAKQVVKEVMNGEIATANSQVDDGVSH